MKSEEDKKSRPVRIRMTQDQYKHVKEKADEQNLTFSAYVVEAVVRTKCSTGYILKGNNYVIAEKIIQLHNDFCEATDALEPVNPELASKMRRKGDSLWQLL